MAVPEGTGAREFTPEVNHITNGDPGNQNTFRAPTTDLEKRTNALLDFANSLEAFVHALLGTSDTAVSGVQGNFNTQHGHSGAADGFLMDFQKIYSNGNSDATLNIASNGSFTLNLNTGTTFVIKANDGTTLLSVDNDSKEVTIGTAPPVSFP